MNPEEQSSPTTTPKSSPLRKRWSFFATSSSRQVEAAGKETDSTELATAKSQDGAKSSDLELPQNSENSRQKSLSKKTSLGSFFAKLVGSKSFSSSLSNIPVEAEPKADAVEGGQSEAHAADQEAEGKQTPTLSIDVLPAAAVLPPKDKPESPAKGLFAGFSLGLTPSTSALSESPASSTGGTPGKPSTLTRVLSSTTTPFLSWLKGSARSEDESVVNPMLHLATYAMNQEELNNESTSTIHHVLPGGKGAIPTDFWDGMDDDSSVESFDSVDERQHIATELAKPVERSDEESLVIQTTDPVDSGPALSIEEKLQLVFDLPEKETYKTEFACWLVRSVLLKGYMYVTNHHLCFYSALPTVPGPVRKEGFLQKRSIKRPTSVFYTYWFVLKTDGLYIYADQKTPYYPKTTIYLKNVVRVEVDADKQCIKLQTTKKEYAFKADTTVQMNEWVEAIKAAVFNAKISGNDVRVVLPFDSIADLSITKTNFNNDSLRILVACDESLQPEEYFFSYFNNVEQAYSLMKTLWHEAKQASKSPTGRLRSMNRRPLDSTSPRPVRGATEKTNPLSMLVHAHSQPSLHDTSPAGYVEARPPRLDWAPPISIPSEPSRQSLHRKSSSFTAPLSVPDFRTLTPDLEYSKEDLEQNRPNSMDAPRPAAATVDKRRSWWGHRKTSSDGGEPVVVEDDFQVAEVKNDQFKSFFAIPETERLLQSYSCYINRVIPLLGKVYLSTNYICFKSIRVGYRMKAVIAIADIKKLDFKKGYSPFYNALVITTKNNDEIIFDFHTADTRQKCFSLLNNLMASSATHSGTGTPKTVRPKSALLHDISHLEQHLKSTFSEDEISKVHPLVNRPKILPPRKLHITCLTIGTRGDVQPYIALCKVLMADGHTCRIATHEEFQEWVESFGIEFRPVKGNPAELMQLCVDYGMFTVAFIREALKKFRGWITELLESCWSAAQGTDLLIESPTAFGGIHVAEALQIPYFSSLPFPWTRTKAYPHPFGVTDRHMGGSYNYMTYVMIDQIMWKALAISVNPWRKSINLPPKSLAVEDSKTPFLYSFSSSVVPPPADWQDWIHLCGYWFLDNPDLSWSPPQSLTDFLQSGSKPVYIGFGSIVVQNPDEMTQIIINACLKSGVRAILSKGWSSRGQTGPAAEITYPDSIYPLKIHHGGAGTTAAGLRAGRPTIIHPFSLDQFFWADRVTDLGAGLCIRKLTVDGLAQALTQITTDTKIQEKAAKIGETIRSENGCENAVQFIYRDLEYSRKRIRQIAAHNRKLAGTKEPKK
ncbi:Sterol 3-beta-glucosyltransferase [Kappamyces sp. JEL0680]|nr:Sterol 3-beta-glucosyltransferase [Kappamyces sp. JEL0680]